MRKNIVLMLVLFLVQSLLYSQNKGSKVGFIDMEYILENMPGYAEAKAQLDEKAIKWKNEIDVKDAKIKKLKEALAAEKPLLTRELIEEREAEINFLDKEGNGISKIIEEKITQKITIPRFGNLQLTESLNVATATAIVLSEFKRLER